ncbi:MAG: hypothetical protein ACOCX9_05005 [Spirochaetota bacterium]
MKMIARLLLIVGVILTSVHGVHLPAQDSFDVHDQLRLTLRVDKTSFYSDEQVELQLVVHNTSKLDASFVVYDKAYTTFQPVVYTDLGREASTMVDYRRMDKSMSEVVKNSGKRRITIKPSEKFVQTVNLRDLYTIETGQSYRVRGYFFPDAGSARAIASDNVLNIDIIPVQTVQKESGVKQVKRSISPSEVVLLALSAEKNENWDLFRKYVDLDKYIQAFSRFARLYSQATEAEKLKILEDFNTFIERDRVDYLVDFSILNENIISEKGLAFVEVKVKRWGARYPFVYKYRYTLEEYRNFWLITNFDATVMKE